MPLTAAMARAIAEQGPVSLAHYMAAANAHYYATRDPLGAGGDFTTAPEISQMFGELVGLWLADLWDRAGRPAAHYVELGPGRGTLAVDALRAMAKAGLTPQVHLVETSPVLRAAQAERLPHAIWHDSVDTLPDEGALLVAANEFFDALPIRQLIRTEQGWRERMVAAAGTVFLPVTGDVPLDRVIPAHLADAATGAIVETSPASVAVMRTLAGRIAHQGGAALIVDYGYDGPAVGDTLQAVSGHGFANPFEQPGGRDLTAHVDFGTLSAAARVEGVSAYGPIDQRDLLRALGIDARADALSRAQPDRADQFATDRDRLTNDMGSLFKAIAVVAPAWPTPAAFA